jgi:hypothetical protein
MNDDDLDMLIASTNPMPGHALATLPLSSAEDELLEALLAGVPRTISGVSPRRQRRRLRRLLVPVASVAALATAIVGLTTVRGFDDGSTAWAAPLVAVAQAAPRYLIASHGWKVVRADEFGGASGEMTFSDGSHNLELRWQPVDQFDGLVADRKSSADLQDTVSVAGASATLFRYEGASDFTSIWKLGDHVLEARAAFATLDEYRTVVRRLKPVDVDAWLRAMPASVIKPVTRGLVVDEMLRGIPLPPAFDATPLHSSTVVKDRYQLGAEVAGAVACGWIESWVAATDAGDATTAKAAVDAMATARTWPVLKDMVRDGDYSEVLWEYADAMAGDGTVLGGRQLTVRESYRVALGCE